MTTAPFAYNRAENLLDVIALLEAHGESAKLIAGGHSLLPIMKLRLAEPERLIDISRVPELRGIHETNGALTVRALTTHHQVATAKAVQSVAPLLAATASRVGDRQVRNRGTIGGALAHADAASDYPAAILALDATIVARGPAGTRRISASDFFVDFLTTALEPNEVLTEVEVDASTASYGWSYQKLANQASGYAIVGVAALVCLGPGDKASDIRIGVTGMSPVPWRAVLTESALNGNVLDNAVIANAAERADQGQEALDDLHGTAEYRRRVTRGLVKRAVIEAAGRAGR